MWPFEQQPAGRLAAGGRFGQFPQRGGGVFDRPRRMRQLVNISSRMRRFVRCLHDQDAQVVEVRRRLAHLFVGAANLHTDARREMNVLPTPECSPPKSGAHQMINRRAMAGPSPVPPKRRVVEPSACRTR